jgi:SpoIIAA-like
MSLQQNMHFESELLSVEASGDFSLESAKQAFLEMLKSVAQYNAEKILFDARNIQGEPLALERFFYGQFAATESRRIADEHKIVPRFAYVMQHPLSDQTRLGETVAVNRGMNVRVFETVKEAIEWLNTRC